MIQSEYTNVQADYFFASLFLYQALILKYWNHKLVIDKVNQQ
jgi:hypothetical protein